MLFELFESEERQTPPTMPHPSFTDDTTRWAAVRSKDPEADGAFVYAVKTTKIYCRPVCKARLARRSNVSFYSLPNDAERAGYRPCKRCEPTASGSMPEAKAVKKVRAWALQKSLRNRRRLSREGTRHTDDIHPEASKLADMATTAGVSKWHFHRICKEISGHTPAGYIKQQSVSDYDPHKALPSSTGGHVELSSIGDADNQAGEWHDSQCDAELFLARPQNPWYTLAESSDADHFSEIFSFLSANQESSEAYNLVMPSFSCGDDLSNFTWDSNDDALAVLFQNPISPAETESVHSWDPTQVPLSLLGGSFPPLQKPSSRGGDGTW